MKQATKAATVNRRTVRLFMIVFSPMNWRCRNELMP